MALTSNEMANFDELMVDKRPDGLNKFLRVFLWASYFIGFILVIMIVGMIKPISFLVAPIIIVGIPLYFAWALPKFVYPLTMRYLNVSYTYTIKSGKFSMIKTCAVKGSKKIKDSFKSVQITDMIAIAPYNDEHKAAADASDIDNRYECCAFLAHPDNYYCIWKDENGKKCVCIFQATNNTVKIMSFHNRATVVTEVQKISAIGK